MKQSTKMFFLIIVGLFIIIPSKANPWMGSLTQINYHQKAKHDKLKIAFKEIISDSRCPVGAQCITSGTTKILLQIGTKKIELALGESIKQKSKSTFYEIKLIDLRPFREKERTFDKEKSFIYLKITQINSN